MNDITAYKQQVLVSLATITAGYPLRGAVDALAAGEVAVIQMSNVSPDLGIAWETVRRVTLPSERSINLLTQGDIIFTTRGSRNFALALEDVQGLAVCSPHFFVIRVIDTNCITPAFLSWQINLRPAQEYFQREATGSFILNIRREVVENLSLVVPPLAQQQAIIALAKTASDERAALTSLITNRNQQMEAIALGLHRTEGPRA